MVLTVPLDVAALSQPRKLLKGTADGLSSGSWFAHLGDGRPEGLVSTVCQITSFYEPNLKSPPHSKVQVSLSA